MLFPNPAKALTEMRRVVKPGGKVAVMVYATLEKNPFWEIFHKTVRRVGNIPSPAPGEAWMFAWENREHSKMSTGGVIF
jgi:ubiquinone/menaquinone biosynthesis C-methylase UbiE